MANISWLRFKARWRVWADVFNPWRRGVSIVIIVLGVLGIVRREFVPNLPIWGDVIRKLPTWAWVLIIMGVLLILALEGIYRLVRKATDNWIDNYRYEHVKLPQLPKELEELFSNYISGEPISKRMKPTTPSAQCLNYRLSPTLKKQWRETLIWLGYNPDDILWEMQKTTPPSGGIQPLVAKRKTFKQR